MNPDYLMLFGSSDPLPETSKSAWIIDSGCTIHVCSDTALFSSLELRDGTTLNGVAGAVPILGYGTVNVGQFTLKDVAYVPSVPFNLFSVTRAISQGNYQLLYGPSEIHLVHSDGRKTLLATAKDDLYYLDSSLEKTYAEMAFSGHQVFIENQSHNDPLLSSEKPSTSAAAIYHARLGHPGYDLYNRFAPLVHYPTVKADSVTRCPTCSVSKGITVKGSVPLLLFMLLFNSFRLMSAVISGTKLSRLTNIF